MKQLGWDLLDRLRRASLEGERAHAFYAPPYREGYTREAILAKNPGLAAVNILLYRKGGEWYFPLMVRSHNENDRHSGQISLPGGRREAWDDDFSCTALRETSEEIGVPVWRMRMVRGLTPLYIPPSNFYVYPFVSYTGREPLFRLQASEAVELIEFPVRLLLSMPLTPERRVLPSSRGQAVPVIVLEGHVIWGATAMILSEFSHLLKKL
ncbi:NUDIX hydrolase [Bergeyella sp. RCAD1439]|uniref:NUDIX hydrolase n=1 Tax=Bergeyella anatis TaxID=3113737 RepID=UPI002E174B6B|nr:CoA pyrophosphatase [Bergeyella sp. RCAD1439]